MLPSAAGKAPTPQVRLPWYRHLYVQVLAAVVLGALLGWLQPDLGASLKPLGDGFIALVKMIIGPVIFVVCLTGAPHAHQLTGLQQPAIADDVQCAGPRDDVRFLRGLGQPDRGAAAHADHGVGVESTIRPEA